MCDETSVLKTLTVGRGFDPLPGKWFDRGGKGARNGTGREPLATEKAKALEDGRGGKIRRLYCDYSQIKLVRVQPIELRRMIMKRNNCLGERADTGETKAMEILIVTAKAMGISDSEIDEQPTWCDLVALIRKVLQSN